MSERNYGLTFGMTGQMYCCSIDDSEIQIAISPKQGEYLIEGEGSLTKLVDPDNSNSNLFDVSVSLISSEIQVRYPPSELSEDLKALCCELVTSAISESQSDTDKIGKQVLNYLKEIEK